MNASLPQYDARSPQAPSVHAKVRLGAVALVGLGGAVGTLMRVLLIGAQQSFSGMLLINVIGSFVLGAVCAAPTLSVRRFRLGERWRLCVGPGVCGGFTSFSAISVLSLMLFQRGSWVLAVAYVLITVVGGAFAFWCAQATVAWVSHRYAPSDPAQCDEGAAPHGS